MATSERPKTSAEAKLGTYAMRQAQALADVVGDLLVERVRQVVQNEIAPMRLLVSDIKAMIGAQNQHVFGKRNVAMVKPAPDTVQAPKADRCTCGSGQPIIARGMCSRCYSRDRYRRKKAAGGKL